MQVSKFLDPGRTHRTLYKPKIKQNIFLALINLEILTAEKLSNERMSKCSETTHFSMSMITSKGKFEK